VVQEFCELPGEPILGPVLALAPHCQALLLGVFKRDVIRNITTLAHVGTLYGVLANRHAMYYEHATYSLGRAKDVST
jgi:hypothetical protein